VRKLPWLPKHRSSDNRSSVSGERLQSAITAVKKSEGGCESFVGVVIRRETPKSRLDPNWGIKGNRFADRNKSAQAIAKIVERMQREFPLAEVNSRGSKKPAI
jgi:hypothetical protein